MSTFNPQVGRQSGITLAMIVRNGGQLFDSLLAAATAHVDEIVIGDTGSTDDSVAVAVNHGATVVQVPWTDDFAAARNAVLPHCHGRWILLLDADENLASVDWQNLRSIVATLDSPHNPRAGRLITRNYLTEHHAKRGWTAVPAPDPHALASGPPAAGFVPSRKVRLFPNHPEIRFSGRLHETVEASLTARDIEAVDLDFPVHHFGLLNPDEAKSRRYLGLARRKSVDEPGNPASWSELADCAIACGQHPEALSAIDQALVLEPANPALRLTAGWLLKEAGHLAQADRQLAAAGARHPITDDTLADVCHLRAQIAMQLERPAEAAPLLAMALRLSPENGHYVNTLGAWHLQNGRGRQAQQTLDRARQLLPNSPEPLVNLAVLYQAIGNEALAREQVLAALRLDPQHPTAIRLVSELDSLPIKGPTALA